MLCMMGGGGRYKAALQSLVDREKELEYLNKELTDSLQSCKEEYR